VGGGVFDTPLRVGIMPRRQNPARTSPLHASLSREPELVPEFPIKMIILKITFDLLRMIYSQRIL